MGALLNGLDAGCNLIGGDDIQYCVNENVSRGDLVMARFSGNFRWKSIAVLLTAALVSTALLQADNTSPSVATDKTSTAKDKSASKGKKVSEKTNDETVTDEKSGEALPSDAKPIPGKYNTLSPAEQHVILKKGTERAFTGEYTDLKDPGTFICRR